MSGVSVKGRPIGDIAGGTQAQTTGKRFRPGMEQFVNATRIRSKGDKIQLCMPQGFLLPEVLRQKPSSELLKRIEQRQKKAKCSICKKPEKKYVCSKTKQIACSFDCYKAIQAAH